MEEKKKLIKQSKIMIAMALVIVFVLAGTYAWMMLTKTSTVVNKITAGTLDLVLDDSISDGIHLEKQVPMSFQQGLTTTPYTFKIVNNGDTAANYTISLEDFYEGVTIPEEGKIDDAKIRYALAKNGEIPTTGNGDAILYAYGGNEKYYTATYNKASNQFTSIKQEKLNGEEYTDFMTYLNNQIQSTGATTADEAFALFKQAIGSSMTYETENSSKRVSHLLSEGRNIEVGTIEGKSEVSYTLYMWIDSKAGIEVNNQIFSGRLNITAEQQTPKYTFSGVYKDSTGTVLPNKQIVIYTPLGEQKKTTTDPEGQFLFDDVPSGVIPMYSIPDGVNPDGKTPTELEETPEVEKTDITIPIVDNISSIVFPNNLIVEQISTVIKKEEKSKYHNKNIVAAYKYVAPTNIVRSDSDTVASYNGCISGEEAECEEFPIDTNTVVPAGTIIKYKVNKSTEKYFHVLHDDGAKITMQQRENTTVGTAWYANEMNNRMGPLTVLPVLEEATSGWSNVNDLTYTMGTTTLYENAYTGCKSYNCDTNSYTLSQRTAKARMIVEQEVQGLLSDRSDVDSCPLWMKNYLNRSVYDANGTMNNPIDNSDGYWTMSSFIGDNGTDTKNVYSVGSGSCWYINKSTFTNIAARAVVEINK